ncbi:MAG: hypothetical protein J1E32_03985 [Treponema sp.]|nr:hypothetical protein [Treponema sp.]
MNMITVGLCGAAVVAYMVILGSIPARTQKLRRQAGNLLLPLKGTSSAKWILIAVFALAVIVLVPFRDMGLFVDAVLLLTALIAAELAAREAAARGMAGVYSDAIVHGTQTIYFSAIESLPTLAYEEDPDSTGNYKTSLSVILRDGRETTLVFADEHERAAAVRTILGCLPRLRP